MNTLFSYFTKVERPRPSDPANVSLDLSSEDEMTPKRMKAGKKRRKCVIESDESDEDGNLKVPVGFSSGVVVNSDGGNEEGNDKGGSSAGAAINGGASSERRKTSKRKCMATPKRAVLSSKVDTPTSTNITPSRKNHTFLHDQLKWLQKDHCRDKKGRGVTHVDYDPKTLQVPQAYYNKLTPGLQQWWIIKAEHFDAIIMFKVGKFYELYHMDAVIGVRELGLVFMKADYAHCGFPEAGFGRYSDSLVQKGYKVVRVEQVETPAMMEQRIKKMGGANKSDRVVRREVCSIITKGTRTLNFFTGDSCDGESVFLLAIKEQPIAESIHNKVFGVCFVDTCVGNFCLGQFRDDAECSRLRTLLAHYPPGHVLYERRGLLPHTSHMVNMLLPSSIKDALVPDEEFWGASKTMQALAEGKYFKSGDSSSVQLPPLLKAMFSDSVGFSVATDYELAASALGACVWCLKRAQLDYSLLSLASFVSYDPLDLASVSLKNAEFASQRLILDDLTLANLDIISPDSRAGTLLEKLDTTVTAFGKRLLRQWLCAPLANVSAIESRQDAVEQLMSNPSLMAQAKTVLCKLPDLERLLRKIHSQGCYTHSEDHPDARAIFFEHVTYSKRKIADFMSVLDGFSMALKVVDIFEPALQNSNKTALLCNLLSIKEGRFPDLENRLAFFENSFDRTKAKEDGVIIPNQGVNSKYDSSKEEVNVILKELDHYLIQQKQKLKCKNMTYWGNGRNRFQIEIPESAVSNLNLEDYELTSQRKGVRRYRTAAIDLMLKKLTAAEEMRNKCLRDTMEDLFHSFDQHFSMWEQAVQCLSILDVLTSLATYSLSASEQMTRPIFVKPCTPALLEVRNGSHPCIMNTHNGGEYIPNDVLIEGQRSCLLVTGPNMGGKSTLMRQTGLLVVLAQLGCYVPASKCKLSPVDRVFTRMGACDRIMARESTFFVELKETCSILQHATCHSLVLVDELGRGTATYDGAAIASAVVQQLAQVLRCRTLFSTHYHFLVDQFVGNSCVQLGHMACLVEEEGGEEAITFLYRFTEGLPSSVISLAKRKATICEREAHHIRVLRKLLQPCLNSIELKRILSDTFTD